VPTQGLLSVEGQVLALPHVRPDQAKYSVVRPERIFDGVVAFVHWSWRPQVGAVGNGHEKNPSPLQREMSGRARRASAMRAAVKRISRRSVAAFRDTGQSFYTVAKPKGELDLVEIGAPCRLKRGFSEIGVDQRLYKGDSLPGARGQFRIVILTAEARERLPLPMQPAQKVCEKFVL
jgi:hypothetical protein